MSTSPVLLRAEHVQTLTFEEFGLTSEEIHSRLVGMFARNVASEIKDPKTKDLMMTFIDMETSGDRQTKEVMNLVKQADFANARELADEIPDKEKRDQVHACIKTAVQSFHTIEDWMY